jgi:hypothetical protein
MDPRRIADLALKHRLPTAVGGREYAEAGGLLIRCELPRAVRASGGLRRQDPEGCETRRPSGGAADEARAGHQPQDRQGPRPHHRAVAARARIRSSIDENGSLREVIEAKAKGKEIVTPETPKRPRVTNLMEALQKSLRERPLAKADGRASPRRDRLLVADRPKSCPPAQQFYSRPVAPAGRAPVAWTAGDLRAARLLQRPRDWRTDPGDTNSQGSFGGGPHWAQGPIGRLHDVV